jgi:predicted HTH transcriptional regulator
MRDLFERLRQEGCSFIEELVKNRHPETVQLDFKLKENLTNGELNKKDREILGPALSALANSAGGLLIWGIEAKRGADGVDAAQKKVPIPQLSRFRSDVIRAVAELLMPRHDGIDIETVEDPATAGAGYLAIWVERSARRPHRSEAAGDKRYYKRAGDSSFIMEHYDIEDAFNRIAPTHLRLVFDERRDDGTFGSSDQAIPTFDRRHG